MSSSKETFRSEVFKPKKLIEVAMPLDIINEASVREKSIRRGDKELPEGTVDCNGARGRIYLAPDEAHEQFALVDMPDSELANDPRNLRTKPYGFDDFQRPDTRNAKTDTHRRRRRKLLTTVIVATFTSSNVDEFGLFGVFALEQSAAVRDALKVADVERLPEVHTAARHVTDGFGEPIIQLKTSFGEIQPEQSAAVRDVLKVADVERLPEVHTAARHVTDGFGEPIIQLKTSFGEIQPEQSAAVRDVLKIADVERLPEVHTAARHVD